MINKTINHILEDLLELKVNPNPFAKGIANNADELIEGMIEKFDINKISIHYGNIIKLMSGHPELINNLWRIEVFKSLSNYVINSVFDISSEAMSALEEILFSENKTVELMVRSILEFCILDANSNFY